ncbi:MAG: hypothetical protein JWR15_1406 [Prosthecobacter sp.]|nr:hypothetical protein [Prosthecobacter sp.]
MKPLLQPARALACLVLQLFTFGPGVASAAAAQPLLPKVGFPWQVQPTLQGPNGWDLFQVGWSLTEFALPGRFPDFPLCFYDHSRHHSKVFGAFWVHEPQFIWEMRNHFFRIDKPSPQSAWIDTYSGSLFPIGVVFSNVDVLSLRDTTWPPATGSWLYAPMPCWTPPP